ncbi:hypothetical protein [Streptomyces sp. 7-21]|uniref:hypothetical protein n=1 Tax=Streptomyces sp. 7-21 TaxID=2802283 RepID=UPI00191E6842|nr:hypothetical protein [Streptomyces sp. 7-21]MBL1067937.1 hypothetical protein [Streptomyces sp. 7-21]
MSAKKAPLPGWLHEGATALDPDGKTGVVQFLGHMTVGAEPILHAWLRPSGGGTEWVVEARALKKAEPQ